MTMRISRLFLSVSLGVLLSAGAADVRSQTCTSGGQIKSYTTICNCTDKYFQTYGCPGEGSPKCDPVRDYVECGTDGDQQCDVPKASNQFCPNTSELGAQSPVSVEHGGRSPQIHICPDNSILRGWLQAKLAQKASNRIRSHTPGVS